MTDIQKLYQVTDFLIEVTEAFREELTVQNGGQKDSQFHYYFFFVSSIPTISEMNEEHNAFKGNCAIFKKHCHL